MPNVVRNPYSNTAGNTPSSLGNGVLAVNQADGRIFYRSAAGAVTTFSSIASYATTASFPATGSSSVLYLASDSSKLYQWNGVYVEIGVSGGGGSSDYTLPNATSSTLGGVVVGAGLGVSNGTISANVVSVAGRTGTVTISSSDVSGLGSLATASNVAYSALTGTPSTFAPSSHTHPLSELTQSSATTGQVVTWNGAAWAAVAPFTSLEAYATSVSFPATGSSSVLYLASDSSKLFQFANGVYVEIGVAGGGGSGGSSTPSAADNLYLWSNFR